MGSAHPPRASVQRFRETPSPRGLTASGVPNRSHGSAAPSSFDPATEFHPRIPVHERIVHLALPRFTTPSTQPGRTEPPPPGIPPPGSCCVLAVPARLDALLPARPPRCVSTGRALGVLPSELHLAVIASASRRRIPSCDWLPDPRLHRLSAATGSPVPGALPFPFGLVRASGSRCPTRRIRRSRLDAARGLASGVFSPRSFASGRLSAPSAPFRRASSLRHLAVSSRSGPLPVGAGHRRVSPSTTALALLGFSLPEAFPIPCLGPADGAVTPCGVARPRPEDPASVTLARVFVRRRTVTPPGSSERPSSRALEE
jgi:hypothetical protein